MTYGQRPLGLFFLIIMLLMAFAAGTKKPLCVDSSYVNKIDRVHAQDGLSLSESVYSCQQMRSVQFSEYFYENKNALEHDLKGLEYPLALLGIHTAYELQIDELRPDALNAEDSKILIGQNVLQNSDFKNTLLQQILKMHFSHLNSELLQAVTDQFFPREAKPVFSQMLSESLKQLSFRERLKLWPELLHVLGSSTQSLGKNVESYEELRFWVTQAEQTYPQDMQGFVQKLKKTATSLGYFANADELKKESFDYIFETSSIGNIPENLVQLARANADKKIAYKNSDGLYVLPSQQRYSSDVASELQSRYRIVFDHRASDGLVKSYALNSQKLLVIDDRALTQNLDFSALLADRAADFIRRNKSMRFIQFDLASYSLKAQYLYKITDYFEFVNNPQQPARHSLGWLQTQWLRDIQAFKPVAVFDVIQYFRLN